MTALIALVALLVVAVLAIMAAEAHRRHTITSNRVDWKIPKHRESERCNYCGGFMFWEGPHGCASVNVKCATPGCGRKFCYGGPFGLTEINNSDEFYDMLSKPRSVLDM